MRKIALTALLLAAVMTMCALVMIRFREPLKDLKGVSRIVRMTLCIDAEEPPKAALIDATLKEVFQEYESYATIRFEIVERVSFDGNIADISATQRKYLESISNKQTDMWLIITNQHMSMTLDTDSAPSDTGTLTNLGGMANYISNFAFCYDFTDQAGIKDKGGHPLAATFMKHELGHMFIKGPHSLDIISFMHRYAYDSFGLWTPEVTALIRNGRFRSFS